MSRRFGNVWAVFGSVDIIVRPDVEVELSGTSIMGSKDVKA
jgi:predicted membrane protein